MRKASILATALILAACSRNPEPDVDATGGAEASARDTAMTDTTMMASDSAMMGDSAMAGDSVRTEGDSALVNQDGAAQPTQETMESDSIMGDSTLTGQANDTETMSDSSMMHGDSTMDGMDAPAGDPLPTDSAQGQSP